MTSTENERDDTSGTRGGDSTGEKATESVDTDAGVRTTGLVLRNTNSMQMEGNAPSIRGGSISGGNKTKDDMLLDGLLSSNSRDFDAASTVGTGKGKKVAGTGSRIEKKSSQEVDGLLGYILQSFSGPELVREERSRKQLMMSDVWNPYILCNRACVFLPSFLTER